jgi:hypothetical protein
MAFLAEDPLYQALDIVSGEDVPDFVQLRMAESAGLAAFDPPAF